jgi:hypothetical protein
MGDQALEGFEVLGVLGDGRNLVGGDVATDRLAVFAALEVIIRPVWATTDDAKFTRFHALDLSDLLKDLGRI